MRYELYQPLKNGSKRLVALCEADSDQVTLVHGSPPVVMQTHAPHTSQQPPRPKPTATPVAKICPTCHSVQCHCAAPPPPPLPQAAPRPPRIRTQMQARQAVLQAMMQDVPEPPSFDAIVAKQRELGLR